MIVKRLIAAPIILGLGLALGSCSSVSAVVADHWPHWAGGMPNDVPPRPGAPGYEQFIAHKQQQDDAASPAGSTGKVAPSGPRPTGRAPGDPSVAEGGLY